MKIQALCGWVLFLSSACRANVITPQYDWRLKFETGQTVRVRREDYSSGTVVLQGRKITLKGALALVYSLQVLGVEPDGSARARLKLLSFGYKGDTGQTFYGPFSSVQESVESMLRPYRLAARSSLNLQIGPRGEMNWGGENFEEHRNERRHQAIARRGPNALDEIAAEQTLFRLAEELRLLLAHGPQEPVADGQAWSRTIRAHPTLQPHEHHITAVFSDVTPRGATLKMDSVREERSESEGERKFLRMSRGGQADLDLRTGWPRRAVIDQRTFQRQSILDEQRDKPEIIQSHGKSRTVLTFTITKPE
jgi:hypothetical protein